MFTPRWLAVFVLFATACAAASGCALSDDEDESEIIEEGDSNTIEEELVAERQLIGSELTTKTLSLTFDDGPASRTSELADYLASKGIRATFFINGRNVPGRQGAVDRVVGRGHLLANHTQNHRKLTSLSSATIVSEVRATDDIIELVQRRRPAVLRAPYGAWNGTVAQAINATSMRKYVGGVFWDIGGALTTTSAADWACWAQGLSVQRCGDLYLREIRTKQRGIVLMHDIHSKTIDMVKYIVPQLIAEGYRFAKIEDVPSVKRALAYTATDDGCYSATLGRTVNENVCVESRFDGKWYRCVYGEWAASWATDTRCTSRYPL